MKTNQIHTKTQQATPARGLRAKYMLGLGLLSLAAVVASGCGGGQKEIDTMDNLKQLSLALIKYHDDNKAWPEKLDDVKPLIGKEGLMGVIGHGKDYAALTANPLTGDNPGYEYVKPQESGPMPIMLYQLRGGKRDESLKVAFRDGSVRDAKSAAP
jgi:hypothetical protein